MKSKIIAAGAALIILVIIAAFSAMSIVQSQTVANVEKSEITETSQNGAAVKWKKISAADGYYIYLSPAGENNFEKVLTVKGGKENTAKLEKLEQATAYDIYVTAYKESSKNVESKEYTAINFCTAPLKQNITSASSQDAGNLTVEWEINPKAAGYQLQYVEGDGKDFSSADTIDIKDKAKASRAIDKLTPKKVYSARVRSYIRYNDAVIAGEWSDVKSAEIQDKVAMPANIDPSKPMIALTFDDGPGYNKASDKILDVLEKYNAKATFFMVGQNAKDHPDNLKRKVKLGMEIGNHTWNHNHYGKDVTAEDIQKCTDAIKSVTGQAPVSFRSTGGNTTSVIRNECKNEGMPLYYWSLDTQDWKYRNADKVYNAVMKNVEDGDIILMHEIYDSTAEAVARMVPELIKQGYQLVTCEQLVYAKTGKKPEAGTQYMNATTVKNETS